LGVSAAAPRERLARTFGDPWLWGGCILYAGLFFALGYARYTVHRNFVDLGVFSQITGSAFGCFCSPLYGSQWAHHFSPILYLAGVFMLVWRSALTLIALQAVAAALFVPAVYGLVLRHADRKTARLAAAVTLLYPALGGMVFGDFYENAFAPAAVAWMLWAFDGGYLGLAALFALLTLAIKEDQAFFLMVAGVLASFRYRDDAPRRNTAIALTFLSVAVALVYVLQIQPHAPGGNPHWAQRFFSWGGGSLGDVFPKGILDRVGFIVLAFLPLLFLPFRTPAFLVAVLPLAEVLGSSSPVTYTIGQHYAGAWLGYVFYAFAIAVCTAWNRDPARIARALYWCIGLCVTEFAVADPLHPGINLHPYQARDAALDRYLARLPAQFDVATQEEAYTHLAATDAHATLLPETPDEPVTACYILTDTAYPESPRLVESSALVDKLVRSGVYRVSDRNGAITLYKRMQGCR
jgi:uncharacterized membrane protein